jgi:cell division protein FtsB
MSKRDRALAAHIKGKTRPAKTRHSFWKLLLCAIFLSFLALDGYRLSQGIQYWWRNREIKQEYVKEVERLRQEQRRLEHEIHNLRYNTLTQERIAREMGYIKPGETVYKFVPKSLDASYF